MIKNVTREEARNNPNLIVPLAADEIFHKVFGTQENVSNTEALISAFLNIPLKDLKGRVRIVSRNMNNLTAYSKNGEKDIVVWVDANEPLKLTIEMNKYSTSLATINRNVFFLSDVFTFGLESGVGYKNVIKTIQLNFNPNYIDKKNKPVIDRYTLKNDHKHELTNKFILYQINLVELSNIWYNKLDKDVTNINPLIVLFGALILENEKDKFKEIIKNKLIDKDISTSIERIVLDMNKESFLLFDHFYDLEECLMEEREATIEEEVEKRVKEAVEKRVEKEVEKRVKETVEKRVEKEVEKRVKEEVEKKVQKAVEKKVKEKVKEGILENQTDIVLTMYKKQYDLDTISDITKLSKEEIQKIINKKSNN